jgi:hypothetical protein
MLEVISEYARTYIQVGAIAGFGIGALAQVIQGTSRDWTLGTCLIITLVWPMIIWDVVKANLK